MYVVKKVVIIIGSIILCLGISLGIYLLIEGKIEAKLNGNQSENVTVKNEYHDEGFEVLRNGNNLDKDSYSVESNNNVDVNCTLQGGPLSSVRRGQIVLNPLNTGLFILA